jgi:hypothetical protein|tara:strand:- start:410 stop:640 length:231 start_codon:yes stop_codon:yes gene_type:complete
MIYKFKIWVWLPMTTEVHLSAIDDEDALKTINKIDLKKGFNWRDDGIRKSKMTYEVINVQNTDKSISSSDIPGKKS